VDCRVPYRVVGRGQAQCSIRAFRLACRPASLNGRSTLRGRRVGGRAQYVSDGWPRRGLVLVVLGLGQLRTRAPCVSQSPRQPRTRSLDESWGSYVRRTRRAASRRERRSVMRSDPSDRRAMPWAAYGPLDSLPVDSAAVRLAPTLAQERGIGAPGGTRGMPRPACHAGTRMAAEPPFCHVFIAEHRVPVR
jgi:hypothetical protein